MLKPFLNKLLSSQTLNHDEAEDAMKLILKGAEPCQIAALLALMRFRGETAAEIAGMIKAIEATSKRIKLPYPVIDIVGTGGDQANTVNLSTGSAILAAACGIPVAKHGNRSVSSKSGSADLLEALGIEVEMEADDIHDCLQHANIAFMYAPYYHPMIQKVGTIRRSLKIPTVFNLLGPLLNPAHAPLALICVAHESSMELMSDTLIFLNRVQRGFVFHGNGLDELSTIGPVTAYAIHGGKKEKIVIDPQHLGFKACSVKDLEGGDAHDNAKLLLDVFSGKGGPIADALVLNAGAALMVYGRAKSLSEGIAQARKVLHEGKALEVVDKWKAFSRSRKTKGNIGVDNG